MPLSPHYLLGHARSPLPPLFRLRLGKLVGPASPPKSAPRQCRSNSARPCEQWSARFPFSSHILVHAETASGNTVRRARERDSDKSARSCTMYAGTCKFGRVSLTGTSRPKCTRTRPRHHGRFRSSRPPQPSHTCHDHSRTVSRTLSPLAVDCPVNSSDHKKNSDRIAFVGAAAQACRDRKKHSGGVVCGCIGYGLAAMLGVGALVQTQGRPSALRQECSRRHSRRHLPPLERRGHLIKGFGDFRV